MVFERKRFDRIAVNLWWHINVRISVELAAADLFGLTGRNQVGDAEADYNLGAVLASLDRVAEAIARYARADRARAHGTDALAVSAPAKYIAH
jgi:hypothetical protein